MLLVVLLFIILLIVFTADKEGGGGGGVLQFDGFNVITSASSICNDPYDQNSTQVIDFYSCVFLSENSISLCSLESNASCSNNLVHTFSNQFDSFICINYITNTNDTITICGINESQTLGNSISALAYIHNKYPQLASYENITNNGMTNIANLSLMSRR